MRASCFRLLALWTAFLPPAAAAQWPGELEGRVVDALTGRGVEAASVGVSGAAGRVVTDASGRFRLRSVSPGPHELTVERLGYEPAHRSVRIENGRTARLVVELVPRAMEVRGLAVRTEGGSGAHRIVPGSPGTAGDRTVADLVEGLPGVTVTGRGPGSARTVSIRGSAPDAVLVLLDGVPLNDPLTGEADLSLVSSEGVGEVVVLPGARSARYGPRAEAGVILIRSGEAPTGLQAEASVGSLGRRGGALGWSGGGAGTRWFLTGSGDARGGRFRFRKDAVVGGGVATRTNADLSRWGVRGGADAGLLGGSARVRLGIDRLERGLPGRSFAPSPAARQDERRFHLSAGWAGPVAGVPADLEAYAARHRGRFRDPAPPVGLPYDETSRVGHVGLRGRVAHPTPPGPLHELALGWELERQSVRADALEPTSPVRRTDAGAFVTTGAPVAREVRVRGVARVDRDGSTGHVVGSHEVELSATPGPLQLRVSHRSSWSPPALADRFFRAGVGVEPNPDLRAVRVPSELDVGVSATVLLGGWRLDASVDTYRADVRGMVVWSPDFRFVWSPRNVDVLRRGIDVRLDGIAGLGSGDLRVSSSWSRTRVTHAREDLREVQLRYRPRHSARLAADWGSPVHGLGVEARYIGSRLPGPSEANRLPGFWTLDVTATTAVDLGGWTVRTTLRVERAADARDSMIFAFPEPGRTVGLELAFRPAPDRPRSR